MIKLSADQIKKLHQQMLDATGGLGGICDEALLDSALSSPLQAFGETELFPSIVAKIACITFGIIRNHPFVDGNKRIATYAMLILFELNNIEVDFSDYDIFRIGIELASGEMDYEQLLALISQHIII